MWVFTVASLTTRRAAISGLRSPSPMRRSTSRSRAVSGVAKAPSRAGGAERRVARASRRRCTSGASTAWPWPALRTDCTRVAWSASFVR